jgi:hypothetical protein
MKICEQISLMTGLIMNAKQKCNFLYLQIRKLILALHNLLSWSSGS